MPPSYAQKVNSAFSVMVLGLMYLLGLVCNLTSILLTMYSVQVCKCFSLCVTKLTSVELLEIVVKGLIPRNMTVVR